MLFSRKLATLALGIVSLGVLAAVEKAFTPALLFGGHNVPIANGSSYQYAHPEGLLTDSTASNLSRYAWFGPSNPNVKLDAVITLVTGYGGASFAGYFSNTYCHAGLVTRFAAGSEFGGMVLLTAETTNEIHTIDRVGGTEYLTKHRLPPGTLRYGSPYRIIIDNTETSRVDVMLYDYKSGTLITNLTVYITNTAVAGGKPATHTYAAAFVLNRLKTTYPDGTAFHSTATFFQDNHANDHGGMWVSNGVAILYSNGSSNSANGWCYPVGSLRAKSGSIHGYMRPVSGRNHGISIRNTAEGKGIALYWDNSSALIRLATNVIVSPALIETRAASLSLGTEYEWTLRFLSSTTFSWTIAGATHTFTNSTYPTGEFIGFLGYQGLTHHRNITLGP